MPSELPLLHGPHRTCADGTAQVTASTAAPPKAMIAARLQPGQYDGRRYAMDAYPHIPRVWPGVEWHSLPGYLLGRLGLAHVSSAAGVPRLGWCRSPSGWLGFPGYGRRSVAAQWPPVHAGRNATSSLPVAPKRHLTRAKGKGLLCDHGMPVACQDPARRLLLAGLARGRRKRFGAAHALRPRLCGRRPYEGRCWRPVGKPAVAMIVSLP
jgi:hypothetical protein